MKRCFVIIALVTCISGCLQLIPVPPNANVANPDQNSNLGDAERGYQEIVNDLKGLPFKDIKWWYKLDDGEVLRITLFQEHLFVETFEVPGDRFTQPAYKLIAIKRDTGEQAWRFSVPVNAPPQWTPAIATQAVELRREKDRECREIEEQIRKEKMSLKPDYNKLIELRKKLKKATTERDYAAVGDNLYLIIGRKLYCIDRVLGNLLWTKDLYFSPSAPAYPIRSYVFIPETELGRVHALDVNKNGEEYGEYPAAVRAGDKPISRDNSISAAPVSDGRFVFFGSHNGMMYAYRIGTFIIAWVYQTGDAIKSPPVLREYTLVTKDEKGVEKKHKYSLLMFGGIDQSFYALYSHVGEVAWRYEAGAKISAPALIHRETVYVITEDNCVHALDLYPVYRKDDQVVGVKRMGNLKWKYPGAIQVLFNHKGLVYLLTGDKKIVAVDENTGEQKFEYRTPTIDIYITNLEDDKLFYVATRDGYIFALQESPTEY